MFSRTHDARVALRAASAWRFSPGGGSMTVDISELAALLVGCLFLWRSEAPGVKKMKPSSSKGAKIVPSARINCMAPKKRLQ
jgi:hypothetical protein